MDPSLKIVGNDPFPQAVEDIGKVVYLFPHPLAFSLREYPGRRLRWSREIPLSAFYKAVVFFHGRIGFTLLIIAPWPPCWRQILRTMDEKIYRRRAIINPSCSGECPGRKASRGMASQSESEEIFLLKGSAPRKPTLSTIKSPPGLSRR